MYHLCIKPEEDVKMVNTDIIFVNVEKISPSLCSKNNYKKIWRFCLQKERLKVGLNVASKSLVHFSGQETTERNLAA